MALSDFKGGVNSSPLIFGDKLIGAWTIEVKHKVAHKVGAPGLFGFSPQSKKRVFVDNLSIEAN